MVLGSRTPFLMKAGTLALALPLAAAAFAHAASEAEVLSLGPGTSDRLGLDSHIAGELADRRFKLEMANRQLQGGIPPASASVIALARDSYGVDPLEISSLRTIALGSILQEDPERARRAMHLAERISKRDSVTNLWLAEDYLREGNAEAMLTSFDHALRTSSRVREFAMKPVVEALASAESYEPLGKLLDERPEWEEDFWRELARNPVGNAYVVEFLRTAAIPLDRIPEQMRRALYVNLRRGQRYDSLFGLAELDPQGGRNAEALASGKFVTADEANPLGWTLFSQGGFATRVPAKTGELQIDARSGAFGIAADRIVRGDRRYRLVARMAEPVPDNAEIKLVARCAGAGGRELGGLTLRAGDRLGEAEFAADDCRYFGLELSFATDPGRRDALIRLASIELR